MKRLVISGWFVVAVIAVGADMMWSRPGTLELVSATAAMPSLLELHATAGVNELPTLEMEDQSLVYPTIEKR
jgi:hypothetical protein